MQRFDGDRVESGAVEATEAATPTLDVQKRAEAQAAQTADVEAELGANGGPVQAVGAMSGASVPEIAAGGVSGSGGSLPHADRIQASFGRHDVSDVQAHVGGAAGDAASAIGAKAYATTTSSGPQVAFKASPDLHLAAHEAAHTVQQKGGVQLKGGVGEVGDVYERNADAVADAVVAGRSAEGLLDPFAGSGSGGGVQRAVVQKAGIKDDLRKAMEGWGTDEDSIYDRLRQATAPELQSVVQDSVLMGELRSELTHAEMRRVLDLLNAPLGMKITLAIKGWGTDEDYIWRSLQGAPIAQVSALAANSTQMQALMDDLNAQEQARARGIMAGRIYSEASNADVAIDLLRRNDKVVREWMDACGAITRQRALCDAVIVAGTDLNRVKAAFQHYWNVDLKKKDATDAAGTNHVATEWPVSTLQAVHAELKRLPEQDARSQVFRTLTRVANSSGGYMDNITGSSDYGEFGLGENAEGVGTQPYGVGTELRRQAAGNQKDLLVKDPSVFGVGDTVAVGPRPSADVHQISAIDTGNRKYTLNNNLSKAYARDTRVTPDNDTAIRDVSWVEAVVRHEIAHAIDPEIGITGFTQGLGGWWSGTEFDTWASQMGSPWSTNDNSTITDAEKTEIKDHIVAQMRTAGGNALNNGLSATHAINKYWGKGVPVIEAAKPCVAAGKGYWQNPQVVKGYNNHYFAINHYYNQFQYYKSEVQTNRVRAYSIFSEAEFFAEVYTVYYEEAGRVPDNQLGRLVPVTSWRNWIKTNVHDRGKSPGDAQKAGSTSARTGMKTGNSR